VTAQRFDRPGGGAFAFPELAGKWVLVASDSGACAPACRAKLATLRQVRLALGRNAGRVERVFVVDDLGRPAPGALEEFAGTHVAFTPTGLSLPLGAGNDRAHIYLVDPRGNVMMRWPAGADRKRMLADLQRLLKASQIG
jgi:cytochrome oxidase Cu insertion factor (SCO1/SenC/PrrC family)